VTHPGYDRNGIEPSVSAIDRAIKDISHGWIRGFSVMATSPHSSEGRAMTTSTQPVAEFGTLAWARANGGHLSRRERLAELGRSTRVLPSLMLARAATRLQVPARNAVVLDANEIRFPDSRIAKEAAEECHDSVSEMLYNHSVRTYLWGLMLARRDGLELDLELFYVASMLHDLTLGDVHRDYAPMECFAARGGLLAEDWTAARGWEPERRAAVSNAISLHLNTHVHPRFGPEAQMLRAGAGVDTIGLRYRHLDPTSVNEVLQRFPRCGLKDAGPLTFEVEGRKGTRAGLLDSIGFGMLVRTSEFAE
jgi:hypothetical protein